VSTHATTKIYSTAGSALVAADFPDMTTRIHSLGVRADYDLTDNLTLRVGYALERFNSFDWATDTSTLTTMGRVLTAGQTSLNDTTHIVAASVRVKF